MKRTSSSLILALVLAAGCTGSSQPEPDELSTRGLLGLDPALTVGWTAAERADARDAFAGALADVDPARLHATEIELDVALADSPDVAISRGLDAADLPLARAELPPRLVVHVAGATASATPHAMIDERALAELPTSADAPPPIELLGWEAGAAAGWDQLPRRVPRFLTAIAEAAGRPAHGGTLEVVAAPQVAFAAAWDAVHEHLLVNPVMLAALEPEADAASASISVAVRALPAIAALANQVDHAHAPAPVTDDGVAVGAGDELPDAMPAGTFPADPDAATPPPTTSSNSCGSCDCGSCSACDIGNPQCDNSNTNSGCGSSGCGGSGGGCSGGGGGGSCAVGGAGEASLVWASAPLFVLGLWQRRERRRDRRRDPQDPGCDRG